MYGCFRPINKRKHIHTAHNSQTLFNGIARNISWLLAGQRRRRRRPAGRAGVCALLVQLSLVSFTVCIDHICLRRGDDVQRESKLAAADRRALMLTSAAHRAVTWRTWPSTLWLAVRIFDGPFCKFVRFLAPVDRLD